MTKQIYLEQFNIHNISTNPYLFVAEGSSKMDKQGAPPSYEAAVGNPQMSFAPPQPMPMPAPGIKTDLSDR